MSTHSNLPKWDDIGPHFQYGTRAQSTQILDQENKRKSNITRIQERVGIDSQTARVNSSEFLLSCHSEKKLDDAESIFKCREAFLNISELLVSMTDYLRNIEAYVDNEAELTVAVVSDSVADSYRIGRFIRGRKQLASQCHQDIASVMPSGVAKEALVLAEKYGVLEEALISCFKTISICFEHRKAVYFKEINKAKEISNAAIRNAAQYERNAAGVSMSQLKETFQLQMALSDETLRVTKRDEQYKYQLLEAKMKELEAENSDLVAKDANRLELQEEAVRVAVSALQNDVREDHKQTLNLMLAENKRVNDEAEARIEANQKDNQARLDTMQTHESEIRSILTSERDHLQSECVALRAKLADSTAQASAECDRLRYQMDEERRALEKKHESELSEALASQANFQAQISAILHQQKIAESERLSNEDYREAKLRESLIAEHAVDCQNLSDRHRSEIRRIQTNMDNKISNVVSALRRTHEQEINRLIRDRDRLQAIIVRSGAANLLSSSHAPILISDGNLTTSPQPQAKGTQSPSLRSVKRYGDTPPQAAKSDGLSKAKQRLPLNWGTLSESLNKQKETLESSDREDIPEPFLLDESLEASKPGRSSNNGLGIDTNAGRVGKYMRRLEKYLESNSLPDYQISEERGAFTDIYIPGSDDSEESVRSSDSFDGILNNLSMTST